MKDLHLEITIEFGLKTVNYLDITLDLNTSSYKPFRKPNDTPCYIDKNSNHPLIFPYKCGTLVGKYLGDLLHKVGNYLGYFNM